MAITNARMQMRRGLEADFDPNKMQPGEWAVSLDTRYVRMCFAQGIVLRMATYEAFEADMAEIQSIMAEARTIQEAVARIQTEINNTAIVVEDYAILSKSYAVGGTGTRIGEDTDNSKYYSELAKTESDKATTEADRAKTEADRAYSIVNIGIATTEKAGIVKPDGTTITVDADGTIHSVGGGGTAGTMDYEDLSNKPSVNGIELSGNKTTSDLGITAESVGADVVGSASTALSNAKDYTDTKIADLVGGAPATLDTLKEISDALAASEEAVEAINQAIGNKLEKNGDSKDNTVTFTQANTRENILPTEKHSTLFGKIAKWFSDLKTVAFSGSYNDLSNKPTIPTVNDATLTIQKNGNTVQTFTANASSNKTANIIVPTKTSELENDSGFMGSATALDTYEEIMANTESGKFAGAKGVKEGFTQLNNSLNRLEKYSTSEQVIGTWIDGKPLYRKVFYISGITIDTGTTIESGITNIDIVKSLDGIFKFTATKDSDLFALNYFQNGYGIAIRLKPDGNFFFERSAWLSGDLDYLIITIEYTKTTTA